MDPSFKYSESDADRDENRQIVLHKSIDKCRGRKEGGLQEGEECTTHNSMQFLASKGFYGRCLMTVSTVSDLIARLSRLPRSTLGLAGNVVVDTNYNWNCMRLAAGLVPADCWLLPALDSAFPPAQQLGQFFIIFMLHLAHVLIKSSPESPVGSVRVGWVRNGNGCAATEQEDRWLHFKSGTCM